ncbi:MAG TPA: metallophosphoesterase [Candidatus Polarisedimenticolia bacterium]|jgi:UDP-2,3-diacylglucosamine hydrolase|nr:metallophosphoesterase [Candidatus Polarisedimenticolia bacterium]
MASPDAPIVLLGDAHLREDDPEIAAFVRFLDALPGDIRTLAILGDLFAVWIGSPDLQRPHHRRVIAALERLRARGCVLLYIEGNHDFFLERMDGGRPFDRLAPDSLEITESGRRVHLAHGDLVNSRDRQYLAWRRLSKSRLFFSCFSLLPAGARLAIADRLETRLAKTNVEFRGGFPFSECEAYARRRIGVGDEILVFGHFHDERRIDYRVGESRGSVFVLPAWRTGHRYLRIDPGAEPAFASA